jgi:hypothetical protein
MKSIIATMIAFIKIPKGKGFIFSSIISFLFVNNFIIKAEAHKLFLNELL